MSCPPSPPRLAHRSLSTNERRSEPWAHRSRPHRCTLSLLPLPRYLSRSGRSSATRGLVREGRCACPSCAAAAGPSRCEVGLLIAGLRDCLVVLSRAASACCSLATGRSVRASGAVSASVLASNSYYLCWAPGGSHAAAGAVAVATIAVVVVCVPLATLVALWRERQKRSGVLWQVQWRALY